jgi:hypothetical protein
LHSPAREMHDLSDTFNLASICTLRNAKANKSGRLLCVRY